MGRVEKIYPFIITKKGMKDGSINNDVSLVSRNDMDDYIIDVYHVINPYKNEYIHLERIRFKDIKKMLDHLKHVEEKYNKIIKGKSLDKTLDYIITTCKGDDSANYVFKKIVERLGRLPVKSEIN